MVQYSKACWYDLNQAFMSPVINIPLQNQPNVRQIMNDSSTA